MKNKAVLTCGIFLLIIGGGFAEPVCPKETDENSLRHSKLSTANKSEILRIDVDKDGDPDIIERWWNDKRVRWFDENDDATVNDFWGDMVSDSLQVDLDGDGFYDGPSDYNVKWADRDGDGVPDIQVFNKNPHAKSETVFASSAAVCFITIDPDNTGMLMDIKWSDLTPGWTRLDRGPNWRNNYHGNATFLKEHAPIWSIENPEYSWENPFLFFDPDGDGLSEVSVRVADNRKFFGEGNNRLRFDGIVDDAWVSYDLDNDTGRDNEKDYDLTLYVAGGAGLDYNDQVHDFPQLRAPDWVLPYYRYPEWRQQTRFVYLNRDGAVARLFGAQWAKAYLTVDEDDDDHRWERVELYYPGDPYVLKRRKHGESMIWHPQSDTLGDRGEWDEDFSGKAKLYRAEWDGKIHLLGAERGAWTVDRNREFWGGAQDNGVASTKAATQVGEVIQYRDSDGNGYLDTIIYDYNGDQIPERTDNLLKLGVDDKGVIIDVVSNDWNAMRIENAVAANRAWGHAQRLYRLAFRYGFAGEDAFALSRASSVAEKENNAFWLRETLIRKILTQVKPAQHPVLMKAYYENDMETMSALLEKVPLTNREKAMSSSAAEARNGSEKKYDFTNNNSDKKEASLSSIGWKGLALQSSTGKNIDISDVTGPVGINPGNYAFFAPRVVSGEIQLKREPCLVFTAKSDIQVDVKTLTAVRYSHAGDPIDATYRVALKIDGQWFAQSNGTVDKRDNQGPVFLPASFEPEDFSAAENWNQLVGVESGQGPIVLGGKPQANLTGKIEAIGLLLSSETSGDHIRVKDFSVETSREEEPRLASLNTGRTFARYVPERADDFAWENDKIAFRAYGPALRNAAENSGIDCWFKRVNYPIIDKWYGQMKEKTYHKDWGEGHDPYHVGSTAGCGGTGIWIDGKREPLETYTKQEVISCTPEKSVFKLTYEKEIGGVKYGEEKTITIELGKRLFDVHSVFTKNGKIASELPVCIGVTTHNGKAASFSDEKRGWIACWEKIDDSELGTAAMADPKRIDEIKVVNSDQKDESHIFILMKTDSKGALDYKAGYGWAKAGEITTRKAWEDYLNKQ